MNATTIRSSPTDADTRADRGLSAPFAALPHDIAADPRLSPTDVRVLLALLFYARAKAACWPSDATIGSRVGRSVSTVQRALRRLQALGLVQRIPDDGNRTGRRIVLAWRGRLTPASSVTDPPASPMTDEGRREREAKRPESAAGYEGPPPPAGDGRTEPDLAMLHLWAEGTDPILRRIAERRLAELGAGAGAVVHGDDPHSCPGTPVIEPVTSPQAPASAVGSTISPVGEKSATRAQARSTRATPSAARSTLPAYSRDIPRPGSGPARRQRPLAAAPRPGPTPVGSALAAWMTRRAP